MEEKDNQAPVFSGETKDWPTFKDALKELRAALKEQDQRLSTLEAKFDSFSNEQKDGGNKRKKPARKNGKECNYCKKAGKWFQGHEESECHHKKKG